MPDREVRGLGTEKMYVFGGKKLCYSRADDWDYFDIAEWRASTKDASKCKPEEILCGGNSKSTAAYCMERGVHKDNGNLCPYNAFTVTKKHVS